MKDNALRTLTTVVVLIILLILVIEYVFFPWLFRVMDEIDERSCRSAFEVTGYISERCATLIGR